MSSSTYVTLIETKEAMLLGILWGFAAGRSIVGEKNLACSSETSETWVGRLTIEPHEEADHYTYNGFQVILE